MWHSKDQTPGWHDAIKKLKGDGIMLSIIYRVGPCTFKPMGQPYIKLVQSIISQQISVKAADAMYKRLTSHFPGKRISPQKMADFQAMTDVETLKACGMSTQKRSYITDLTNKFLDGTIEPKKFETMTDQEIIDSLTLIKGIGVWTAQMFLMFSLGRPDVWPVGDLALRDSVARHYAIKDREDLPAIAKVGERFAPYRSIATWYLWKDKEG
jgi:DNA-3-methyladenine glycosylase II